MSPGRVLSWKWGLSLAWAEAASRRVKARMSPGPPMGWPSKASLGNTTASLSPLAVSTSRAAGKLSMNWPLPQASSGLPSPDTGPMVASTAARSPADSGGSSTPAAGAASSSSSAKPPEAVTTETRLPVGQRRPWHTASTSVSSSSPSTSMAPWARSTSDITLVPVASPPVWLVMARRVRSLRPTFRATTGLPAASARSRAAV